MIGKRKRRSPVKNPLRGRRRRMRPERPDDDMPDETDEILVCGAAPDKPGA